MSLTTRLGLAEIGADGDKLTAASYNQGRYHALAIARVFAELFGGEGIYTGGATVVGDLTGSGANYPAFRAIVYDDNGEAWLFNPTAVTAMTFTDTSGACTAYLIVKQQAGIAAASAIGGRADFQIVVQLTATAAPAHSLPLGAGSVTASKFTTWTPDASVFVASGASQFARLSLANTFTALNTFASNLRIKDGGTHYATLAAATHAADRTYTLPDAGAAANIVMSEGTQTSNAAMTWAGRNVYANGMLTVVRDTKYGPPTSGAHIVGDAWMDLAGAEWHCTASGTPGTWVQVSDGTVETGGAGEAWADFVTAGHWNGGALLNGYRARDAVTNEPWMYLSALTRWVGPPETKTMTPIGPWVAAGYSATANFIFAWPFDSAWDWMIDKLCFYMNCGTDVSNYWTIKADLTSGGNILTSAAIYANGYHALTVTSPGPWTAGTNISVALTLTKTGTASAVAYLEPGLQVRKVHP